MALEEKDIVTFTYKEDVGGFPTFKSYIPDWGVSLNNRYYTFKLGSIWEHNIDTDESITNIALDEPITITYDDENELKELEFEITGNIVGLGLVNEDRFEMDIYNETEGEVYQNVHGYIPVAPAENDSDDFKPLIVLESNPIENIAGIPKNSNHDFKIIDLRRKNFNAVDRNVFYEDRPIDNEPPLSRVEFIINNDPSVVKQFKTLGYEGIGKWDFEIYTDVESEIEDEDDIPKKYKPSTLAGIINKDDLVEREGKFFANIRGKDDKNNPENIDLKSINVQGIGKGSPTGLLSESKVLIEGNLGSDVKKGYDLYFFSNLSLPGVQDNFDKQLKYAGSIESIDGNIIEYDKGTSGIDPSTEDFFLYVRENRIEKSGVIGSYAHVVMTNEDKEHAEIFSVNSEVVQSSQ